MDRISELLRPIAKTSLLRRSAFNYFAKLNGAAIKAELVTEGKDSSLGVVASVISAKVVHDHTEHNNLILSDDVAVFIAQFKSLPDNERAKYQKLAEDDRNRYDRECEV